MKSQAKSNTCTNCGETKPLSEFHKSSASKLGVKSICKPCRREKEGEANRKRATEYYKNNRDKVLAYHVQYRELNRDMLIEKNRKYYQENRELCLKRCKEYEDNNRDKVNESARKWKAKKRKNDPIFVMGERVRALIVNAFKDYGYSKNSKTKEILGIDYHGLCYHIESLFMDGMTWENKGKWHIDHIVPLSFANTEEDIVELNHYSNLRPLWAEMNMARGDNINEFIDHCEYSLGVIEKYNENSPLSL